MDGMSESWEPEEEESMPRPPDFNLIDEVARLRVEADSLFKRAKKAEEKNKALTAERDDLRADNERLRGLAETNAADAAERERDEAMAHVADLRGALDWINRRGGCGLDVHDRIRAVCARTPAQSLGRMKAEALREMARLFMATANSDLSYHNRDLAARFCNAEADRLEKKATNGTN
jgi:hypothetical protein